MPDSQIIHRLLVLGALSSTALAAACGGDSSKANDSNTADDSGGSATTTSGATGPGAGGSEASATATGGSSTTDSSSTASGTGGTGDSTSAGNTASGGVGGSTTGTSGAGAQAGAGGEAGTTNAGGTTNSGGNAGNGGSGGANNTTMGSAGGTGGDGGNGGSGGVPPPVTVVGTLGEPCDAPGTLACAGNHQKLTVVCGGDGEWETNQTCGATEFCDSVEGDTTGLCLEPEAECEGREPDDTICVDGNVYSCAPDGIRPWLSEVCTGFCQDGVCDERRDRCPVESDELQVVNCDPACGDLSTFCSGADTVSGWSHGYAAVVRLASYDDARALDCQPVRTFYIRTPGYIEPPYDARRVTVREPWQLAPGSAEQTACDGDGASCVMAGPSDRVLVFTDDPTAGERNVMFEPVEEGATCDDL